MHRLEIVEFNAVVPLVEWQKQNQYIMWVDGWLGGPTHNGDLQNSISIKCVLCCVVWLLYHYGCWCFKWCTWTLWWPSGGCFRRGFCQRHMREQQWWDPRSWWTSHCHSFQAASVEKDLQGWLRGVATHSIRSSPSPTQSAHQASQSLHSLIGKHNVVTQIS